LISLPLPSLVSERGRRAVARLHGHHAFPDGALQG
jgi:hypothetical protein